MGLDWGSLDDATKLILTLWPLALVGLMDLIKKDEAVDWEELRAYHSERKRQRRQKEAARRGKEDQKQ